MSTEALFVIKSGDDLLSHAVADAVPSALEGLTSVFGMGTGVTPPLESPEILNFKSDDVGFQAGQILWSSLTTD